MIWIGVHKGAYIVACRLTFFNQYKGNQEPIRRTLQLHPWKSQEEQGKSQRWFLRHSRENPKVYRRRKVNESNVTTINPETRVRTRSLRKRLRPTCLRSFYQCIASYWCNHLCPFEKMPAIPILKSFEKFLSMKWIIENLEKNTSVTTVEEFRRENSAIHFIWIIMSNDKST